MNFRNTRILALLASAAGWFGCSGNDPAASSKRVGVARGLSLELPRSFDAAVNVDPAERAMRVADGGATRPPADGVERFYMGYRSTLSGYPEFEACFAASVGSDVSAFKAGAIGRFRDPQWSGVPWAALPSGGGATVETGIPPNPQLGMPERRRLVRVYAYYPEHDLMLGLVARQGKISPEQALAILAKAAGTIVAEPAP